MTNDPQYAGDYSPERTILAEQLLAELWSALGDYHEYLVLVGGLVPRYLIPQDAQTIPEHYGTVDVDLAIDIAVRDAKAYAGIRQTLEHIGLKPGVNDTNRARLHSFEMQLGRHTLNVDFLTVRYDGPDDSLMRAIETNLSAIQVRGVGLALKEPIKVHREIKTIAGGLRQCAFRVCRPIPFIVLKALALQKRNKPKDAGDLVYLLRYHSSTPAELAALVRPDEREAEAFAAAVSTLRELFATPAHDGAVRYGLFLHPGPDAVGRSTAAVEAFAAVQEFLAGLEDSSR